MNNRYKAVSIIKVIIYVVLLFLAFKKRILYISQTSKDIYAYERAISDLFSGTNPYLWSIESYSNPDDPGNHGFVYLPGILYLYGSIYIFCLLFQLPYVVLWKIPILLADFGVAFLIFRLLKDKKYTERLLGVCLWLFNPYSFLRSGYTYIDPLPTLLALLAIIYLERDSVLSGTFYALSVLVKTFPIILFPIFIIRSENKMKFLLSGLLVSLLFFLPFLFDLNDFVTMLNGTFFIHGNRFIQGRPLLFYISYYYNIEFFQIIPFKVYSFLSIVAPWILVSVLGTVLKGIDKYILATVSFLTFYVITPVFNRTYILWAIPFLVMCGFKFNNKVACYALLCGYWLFFYFYLVQWKDGFHVWHP
ncbi:hypothetical protein JXA34_02620 [Patescibacteria group bacterium]|nr:hypothetical protein [Patescibacteria group bacterium]